MTCDRCGQRVALTTAGRPDDPRSITIGCLLHVYIARPETYWQAIRHDIVAGPTAPRNHCGAVAHDLKLLFELFFDVERAAIRFFDGRPSTKPENDRSNR